MGTHDMGPCLYHLAIKGITLQDSYPLYHTIGIWPYTALYGCSIDWKVR